SSSRGGMIAELKRGGWSCTERCCTPETRAELLLPRFQGRQRITFWLEAKQPTVLVVDGEELPVQPSDTQVSLVRAAFRMHVEANPQLALCALVVAPDEPEIPPPAPEPWDASLPVR
ncbi:MAG TPA: hypothetical protein VI299_03905, partial [Polyangiales bacterium]